MKKNDSEEYLAKKRFFDQLLTVYGRKPVLEALQQETVEVYRLHLADSNKEAPIIDEIKQLASAKGAEVLYHDRKALSRISKNTKQDQGVAVDLVCRGYGHYREFLQSPPQPKSTDTAKRPPRLLALCDVQNPQNMGMIIRSACAGDIDGILIPNKGCAPLSPLVIKASAGTLFKAPIVRCETLKETLQDFKNADYSICVLSSHARESLFEHKQEGPIIYILGNESEGVSHDIQNLANKMLMIPMNNGVESLNVAITAALISFSNQL